MARILLLAVLMLVTAAVQGQTRIAVTSSFEPTAQALAERFFEQTGERLTLVDGSTGNLAQQLRQGVAFDAFLAADRSVVEDLVEAGIGTEDTLFHYATGRLVVVADDVENDDGYGPREMLEEEAWETLAIPDDRESPYGEAAMQVLDDLFESRYAVRRTVEGNSSAQTFRFLRGGSVDLGFVPLSLVKHHDIEEGRWWLVPEDRHQPIEHVAVRLTDGSDVAREFLEFLQSDDAREILREAGFE